MKNTRGSGKYLCGFGIGKDSVYIKRENICINCQCDPVEKKEHTVYVMFVFIIFLVGVTYIHPPPAFFFQLKGFFFFFLLIS